eukprot:PhF_6_TR22266/c1_g1_i2/m.31480
MPPKKNLSPRPPDPDLCVFCPGHSLVYRVKPVDLVPTEGSESLLHNYELYGVYMRKEHFLCTNSRKGTCPYGRRCRDIHLNLELDLETLPTNPIHRNVSAMDPADVTESVMAQIQDYKRHDEGLVFNVFNHNSRQTYPVDSSHVIITAGSESYHKAVDTVEDQVPRMQQCSRFQRGMCYRGPDCTFLHVEEYKVPKPKKASSKRTHVPGMGMGLPPVGGVDLVAPTPGGGPPVQQLPPLQQLHQPPQQQQAMQPQAQQPRPLFSFLGAPPPAPLQVHGGKSVTIAPTMWTSATMAQTAPTTLFVPGPHMNNVGGTSWSFSNVQPQQHQQSAFLQQPQMLYFLPADGTTTTPQQSAPHMPIPIGHHPQQLQPTNSNTNPQQQTAFYQHIPTATAPTNAYFQPHMAVAPQMAPMMGQIQGGGGMGAGQPTTRYVYLVPTAPNNSLGGS